MDDKDKEARKSMYGIKENSSGIQSRSERRVA